MHRFDICHPVAVAFFILVLLFADPALAGPNDTQIGSVLCTVVSWMGGNLGKGLECIFMTILGISALLGKISWNTAVIEGVGAAAIMAPAQIVEAMGAGAVLGCTVL